MRDPAGGADRVLVVADARAPAHLPRRSPRRARPRRAGAELPEVPVRRLTVVMTEPLPSADAAGGWLRAARDERTSGRLVADAIALVNRALHAAALAAADPSPRELVPGVALAVRVGYGSGDEVAEGRWSDALELAGVKTRRERRADALRADQRFAAMLGGHDVPSPAETLLLRARADLEANRRREFALQLRAGYEALRADGELREDEGGKLREHEGAVAGAARAALAGGELADEDIGALQQALTACERILRRRAVERP